MLQTEFFELDHGSQKFGLSAALATPFDAEGQIDHQLMTKHAQRCLSRGCDSVTVFGTTGEGPSIAKRERDMVLASFRREGIDGNRLIMGISALAVEDAHDQIEQATNAGCSSVLLPPPSFFKNVCEEGVFRWYRSILSEFSEESPSVILYTIPSQTSVGLSPGLIGRLRTSFPSHIVGVKDSTCDWPHTERLLEAHRDLTILVGDERLLAKAMRLGAKGSICGVANVFPERLKTLIESAREDPTINGLVDVLDRYPIIAAIKTMMAEFLDEPEWSTLRPPLQSLNDGDSATLLSDLKSLDLRTLIRT